MKSTSVVAMPEFATSKATNSLVYSVRLSVHVGAEGALFPATDDFADRTLFHLWPIRGIRVRDRTCSWSTPGTCPSAADCWLTFHQYLPESVVHQLVAQSSRKPVSGFTAGAPDLSARLKAPPKSPIW